jgi:hypothetical protein
VLGGRGVNLFMCDNGARKLLRSLGINSKESILPACVAYAGIFEQSMGAKNRVPYWPPGLQAKLQTKLINM